MPNNFDFHVPFDINITTSVLLLLVWFNFLHDFTLAICYLSGFVIIVDSIYKGFALFLNRMGLNL